MKRTQKLDIRQTFAGWGLDSPAEKWIEDLEAMPVEDPAGWVQAWVGAGVYRPDVANALHARGLTPELAGRTHSARDAKGKVHVDTIGFLYQAELISIDEAAQVAIKMVRGAA